jgi:hypothetical protein
MVVKALGYATIFIQAGKNNISDYFIDARVMYFVKLINNFDLSKSGGL